jgi:general secretion pathway protein D
VVEEPVIDVRLPDPVVEPDDGAASAVTRSAADVAVDAFMIQEELKRIAEREHGLESLRLGEAALADRQFQNAVTRFEEALRFIPDQPNTAEARARARRGLAAAYYVQALAFERMNDLEKAYAAAINAVNYGYIKGEDAVRRLKLKIEKGPIAPPPTKDRLWETDDYAGRQREIKEWLKRGREAYLAGEYAKARSAFESVLARDRYNKEAIRMLRRASEKMYDRSSMELESTRARMMAVVRDTWNPRDYGILETPIESKVGRAAKKPDDEVERERIIEKMKLIRIPEVDFRQANIRDVIHFLHGQSVENDSTEGEGRKGINLILKLDDADGGGAGEASPGAPRDPFASTGDVFGDPAPTPGAGGGSDILVTFSALDITLKEALDIVVDIAHLKYRIRGSVVMIVPFDEASGEIIHRMYDVLPSVVTKFGELGEALKSSDRNASGGGFTTLDPGAPIGGGSAEQDWKGFFSEMGVEWPQRSSIKYVPTIGKIIVANTAENLTVFEKVLSVLNVIPYQIEIEARFVEVAQTDIDSMGLEWLLTDNWELAERKNQAGLPLSARERVVLNSNAGNGGFTKGNRFLTTSAPAGMTIADDVLSLSAVLTNPELTVILHALQRRGNTDLLSAPKITTQSGQEASLKVVTEYIYPTEFETSGIGGQTTTTTGGATVSGGTVGAVVTPTAFATREVGVILSVLPEVTPEGQMINLTMSPEVVSEPTWKNYGSSYQSDINGDGILETQTLNMEQPFFHTRQLNTSMLIYNGATVVMGGMITEVRHDVDDKIPFLGDIPIIGRLFRSKYETSEKRNLLIFVTARLVDPAGRALDQARLDVFNNVIAEGLMDKEPGAKK